MAHLIFKGHLTESGSIKLSTYLALKYMTIIGEINTKTTFEYDKVKSISVGNKILPVKMDSSARETFDLLDTALKFDKRYSDGRNNYNIVGFYSDLEFQQRMLPIYKEKFPCKSVD